MNKNSSKSKKLSSSFDDNLKELENSFENCPDVIIKKVFFSNGKKGCFIYINGMVDIDILNRDFIKPIMGLDIPEAIKDKSIFNISSATIRLYDDFDSIIKQLLQENTAFIMEGVSLAVLGRFEKIESRGIEEPEAEKNIKGPRSGFTELLTTNTAMLRRLISNTTLKFRSFKVGTTTNQTLCIAYIEGIANKSLLQTLIRKIEKINYDGLIAIGYIEQTIMDFPHSPLPQYYATERPDKAVAALLEGRFVILLDGTPIVLIAPVSFFSFFQALDDYSTNWMFGSFIRIVRFIAAIVAVFLPGLYIAIISFHYYMVPLNLLVTLSESRAKVPFPPIIEALIMEITIEMIREASIRLPSYISSSIGVVGGIIIGQAAVEAGIVSNLLIIVVAATAVASFVVPSYDFGLSLRFLRFMLMIVSSIFGIVGIVVLSSLLLSELLTLESLGQPYFQPVVPFKRGGLKDTFLRFPFSFMRKRTTMTQPADDERGTNDGQ
ncbi:MAG TPA: spore germination protein [Clostridia bacterium]|nr:spore germination protein [Clostridia bacterium]